MLIPAVNWLLPLILHIYIWLSQEVEGDNVEANPLIPEIELPLTTSGAVPLLHAMKKCLVTFARALLSKDIKKGKHCDRYVDAYASYNST